MDGFQFESWRKTYTAYENTLPAGPWLSSPGVEGSKVQGKNLFKWKMTNEAQDPMPAKRHVAITGFCCSAIAPALR
jgi:hypothetical protein